MHKHRVSIAGTWLTAVVLALAIGAALAQDTYPVRPVKLVVPFTPGTGVDILARTLGHKMVMIGGSSWSVMIRAPRPTTPGAWA